MKPLLLALPDELADWRGTAAELADQCNTLLAGIPSLSDDAGSANERLVRHYVQSGVLTAPEREGREALFGLRQIVEFLATRYLLKDGWPLAKVAEIVRTTDVDGLAQLIPAERPRTRAEEVLAKYQHGRTAGAPPRTPVARRLSGSRASETDPAYATQPLRRGSGQPASVPAPGPEALLARAADISRRRVSLEENLKALGNPEGRPDRSDIVRLDLTPWCQVHVHARQLAEMTEDTPAILGEALTQALQEERIRRGR
jgi:DNA-binding transcriptional MerR regulator